MGYNILVIDGGGVRGVYEARIIARLKENYPELITQTDFIAGTSTGAIIAAALVAEMDPTDIVDLYKYNLFKIFKDTYWDDIRDLGNLLGADYDYRNLKNVLKKYFKDIKLGDLKKKLLIPTLDLDNESNPRSWRPKFYNNFQTHDLEELLVDILVKTTAAPTYFPTYLGHADGGIAANNPSIAAIAQVLDEETSGKQLSEVKLLSVGAGFSPTYISGKKLDWGLSQWGPFLVDIFFDSMNFVTEYQCKKILKDRYHRINALFDKKIKLDDTSKITTLIECADLQNLTSTNLWLEKYWKNSQNSEK